LIDNNSAKKGKKRQQQQQQQQSKYEGCLQPNKRLEKRRTEGKRKRKGCVVLLLSFTHKYTSFVDTSLVSIFNHFISI